MERATSPKSWPGRKAEIRNLKVGALKTYRDQAVIDVIGGGRNSGASACTPGTLIAIKDT